MPRDALAGQPVQHGDARHWACTLGSNGRPMGVFEVAGAEPRDDALRGVLDLFGRYVGVALAHHERRYALAELSSILEATKSLNSTIDLAELMNIILQLASRQTGAERGTVFLVDRESSQIWSLVGLGLAQQEIRMPIAQGIAGTWPPAARPSTSLTPTRTRASRRSLTASSASERARFCACPSAIRTARSPACCSS